MRSPSLDSILDQNPAWLDELIDTNEAARLIGLSPATLESKRVRPNGSPITFYRIGRTIRYRRRDIFKIIEAGRRLSTSDPGPAAAD